jgi:peptidoglycan L-alanyl-D-glutamate endopeptidase CwlK
LTPEPDKATLFAMPGKLVGVHPELIERVARILAAMDKAGHPMVVTDGVRSSEEQRRLYAQGRTVAGRIVTNADGFQHRSNHQVRLPPSPFAGYGCAVDLAFLDERGRPTWDLRLPWATFGAAVKAEGLTWGGDWKTLRDMPHVELPDPPPETT